MTIVQITEQHAKGLGMDFSDYVRYLVARDAEQKMSQESEPVYYMSHQTEKAVLKGEQEYAEKKTKGFTDINKLMKFLAKKKKK